MLDETTDGRRAENVGSVTENARDFIIHLGQRKRQIELDRARFNIEIAPVQTGQGRQAIERILEDKQGLDQWIAGQITGRAQRLDDFVERCILMGEGLQRRLPGAVNKRGNGGIIRKISPHDQGVHEEADEGLKLWMIAVGDGGPHGQIILPGIAMEQRLERGQRHHEQRRIMLAGQTTQARGQVCIQCKGDVIPAVGLDERASIVGWDIERRRQPRQPFPPIG